MSIKSKPSPTLRRGRGSAERPLLRTLWDRDYKAEDKALRQEGNVDPDNRQVDYGRYYEESYFRLEVDKLWRKTWLYACREEDIPGIGDRVPFTIGPLSFFVVRSGTVEFKAFYNSCIHRGTALCIRPESGSTIRCPFHAWEWNIDGSLKRIPSHWDWPDMSPEKAALSEVAVGRWGGFIFINADPQAPPLADALQIIPDHFHDFAIDRRYTAARFRKLVPANWKIVQEAFMESYHLLGTHPEAVPYNGDSQAQYDIWDGVAGCVGRNAAPSAIPSLHAPSDATPLAAAEVYASSMQQWHYPEAELPVLDPTGNLRSQLGAWHRACMEQAYGHRTDLPDAIMIDSLVYMLFPNSTFWLSESLPFIYTFTPHASDPEKSYFEVRMLLPVPKDKPCPPPAPTVEIALDERIQDKAPLFSFLGVILDQDMSNMPRIQQGLRAANPARRHSELGVYQERLIQHWHERFDRLLSE